MKKLADFPHRDQPIDHSILASMWAMLATMLAIVSGLIYMVWPESQ